MSSMLPLHCQRVTTKRRSDCAAVTSCTKAWHSHFFDSSFSTGSVIHEPWLEFMRARDEELVRRLSRHRRRCSLPRRASTSARTSSRSGPLRPVETWAARLR